MSNPGGVFGTGWRGANQYGQYGRGDMARELRDREYYLRDRQVAAQNAALERQRLAFAREHPVKRERKVITVDNSVTRWCPQGSGPYGPGHAFPDTDPDKKTLTETIPKVNKRTGDPIVDQYGEDVTVVNTFTVCGFHAKGGLFRVDPTPPADTLASPPQSSDGN